MSYFADDPWASSPGSSAPAYSFGEQPAAPQSAFAAPEPTFAVPQTAFAAPQPTFSVPQTALEDPQQAFAETQPAVAASYTTFAAPQPAFAAPPPAFSAPQTAQAFPTPVFATQAGAPVLNNQVNHAAQDQENLQVQQFSEQEKNVLIGFFSCFACCVCTPLIISFIVVILRKIGD